MVKIRDSKANYERKGMQIERGSRGHYFVAVRGGGSGWCDFGGN